MNFVGSQETATRSFILRLPGNIRIGNERRDVSLRELDVTRPMTVFVEWIEDVSTLRKVLEINYCILVQCRLNLLGAC